MTDAIHPDTDIQAEETPILTLDPFAQVTPGLEPAGEEAIVPVQLDESTLTPAERKMVDDFARTIDVTDTGVILQYGAAAQQKVAGFSETALQNVRTKDMGEVGEMLTNLVGQLRTITDEDEEKGFFGFFRKAGNKVSAMKAKYDKAETNVEKICTALENHQVVLMKDIATLDELYKLNLTYFKMAPQIRLVQNNDTMMTEKIQSTLVNTIPLWKSQMVLSLGLAHSQQAMEAQRAVTDMTNELLKKNADALKTATVETAKESERGIVDMETLKHTNESLISTLDEVMRIQDEGRQKRREAEAEIGRIEGELKQKLLQLHN